MLETAPHYLVITGGTTGDILPFMRIASALQGLGRKVTFITNTYHARLVQGAGLAFVGLGTDEEYLRVVANPDLWDPKKGFSVLMAHYSDLLQQIDEAIRSICADAPLVAIAHPFAVPGAAIARERGFIKSVVAAYLAPSNLRSCHDPLTIGPTPVPRWVPMSWRRALWRFVEKGWIDPVALAHLNAVRTPLGLPEVDSFLTHIAQAPDLSVTLFPSWFAPTAPDWPQPLISSDFQLFEAAAQEGFTQDLCAFLAAGEKPLVFTAGTGNLHAADFFACALGAVNRLGRRAVFLSRDRAQAPAHLPESVLWQPYVPLSMLLAHAAALVHHGGIGTAAEALRAGVPQLIAPFAWDQFDNGARIASLGVGMVIPAKRLRPGVLAQSLQAFCASEAVQTQCALLASRFSPVHDPADLCTEIERFVQAKRHDARLTKSADHQLTALAGAGRS
ncbi:MAG: glycosyl transferase family protein [Polaromonas sp.]|nr:glycosyl transferase family protein [Polaromonas sp.]